MMTLWGAEVASPKGLVDAQVHENDTVQDVKRAFAEENEFPFDVAEMELYLTKKDGKWMTEKEARRAIDTIGLKRLDDPHAKLRDVGLTQEEVMRKIDSKLLSTGYGSVFVLVDGPIKVRWLELPRLYPTHRPPYPFLEREALVHKLHTAIVSTDCFVLLTAPYGFGTTTLLSMFGLHYPELCHIQVRLDTDDVNPTVLLAKHGVDVVGKTCHLPDDKMCVLFLDDCDEVLDNVPFWTSLLQDSTSWLPPHVRIVLCAAHLVEAEFPESPVAFGSIPWQLTRDDLQLTEEEVDRIILMPTGLPTKLQFPALIAEIKRKCEGNIRTLRRAIDDVTAVCRHDVKPNEDVVMAYYVDGYFGLVNLARKKYFDEHPDEGHGQVFTIAGNSA